MNIADSGKTGKGHRKTYFGINAWAVPWGDYSHADGQEPISFGLGKDRIRD